MSQDSCRMKSSLNSPLESSTAIYSISGNHGPKTGVPGGHENSRRFSPLYDYVSVLVGIMYNGLWFHCALSALCRRSQHPRHLLLSPFDTRKRDWLGQWKHKCSFSQRLIFGHYLLKSENAVCSRPSEVENPCYRFCRMKYSYKKIPLQS